MGAPFSLMPSHRRHEIGVEIGIHLARVDVLIARLDRADAPFEDLETTGAEDDFCQHFVGGPGCPVADPAGCDHDGRETEEAI